MTDATDPALPSLRARLLNATSVALIGASEEEGSINGRPMRFLERQGFRGDVYPVNPSRTTVLGRACYPSIKDVPVPVDVALVMVRAKLVPDVIRDCVAADVAFAVVLSSGFGEGAGGGGELRQRLLDTLSGSRMRLIGPNCEGLYTVASGMSLTFSPVVDGGHGGAPVAPGDIAVVSQSGGLGFAVAQWGTDVHLGFSHIVTTGNELDLSALDVATELVEDAATRILVMLFEGLDPDRLADLARRARALDKHVVAVKLGRTAAGARATLAHTLHDAGDDASLRRRLADDPIVWADSAEHLVDVLQVLASPRRAYGPRVGIAGTSGGASVWLADACEGEGLAVPSLSAATRARLTELMPAFGSSDNPVDLTAQFLFLTQTFGPPVEVLSGSGEVDAVALAVSLSTPGRLDRHRDELAEALERHRVPLVIYTYTRPADSCIEVMRDLQVPFFSDARRAARAIALGARLFGTETARAGGS